MYFQIRELVLWRRGGSGTRTLRFEPGVVNVISGASKTGKSAVIPIIDYCLASNDCAIPVGVIRETCEWFGIVVDTIEGQKLLARREPGDQQQTGEMFVLEAPLVVVPERIEDRNSTTTVVKAILDRVAALSTLGFDPDAEASYKARPSFRDLVAFVFQPQNIIANPDVLFFKADTTEHREKLRTIFPYVLNALTAEDLAVRWELDRIQRVLRKKQAELNAALSYVDVWKNESLAWLREAIDLGLMASNAQLPKEWPDILDRLLGISKRDSRQARPTIDSLEVPLARLQELRAQETEVASDVSEKRQRLAELRRLVQSSVAYGSAIRVQRDRLSLSKWIRDRAKETDDAMTALGRQGKQHLDALAQALEGIEFELRTHPSVSDRLDREQMRLRQGLEAKLTDLNAIRHEIVVLERSSAEAQEAAYGFDRVERFIGRLQQALILYQRADENADLRQVVVELEDRIEELRKKVSESDVSRRLANAKQTVESIAATIVPSLDVEWPSAVLKLLTDDLTVKIVRGNRDDYLWEIGSGANWLGYHIAVSLSLQRYFLTLPHHPVPGLLIYDQPSQVYFPRRVSEGGEYLTDQWRDEDVIAVRKVFDVLAKEVRGADRRFQVIVLDHADRDVWGDIEGVTLVEEWRDGVNKLVPTHWITTGEGVIE